MNAHSEVRSSPWRVITLVALVALTLAPHLGRVPSWALAVFLPVAGWRIALEHSDRPLPKAWVRVALTFGGAIAAILGTPPAGREFFLTLLVLFVALKLLETRTDRDRRVVVFLCYFLVLTHFLHDESLPTAAYMGLVTLLGTALLVRITDEGCGRGVSRDLGLASVILAQALPLALIAFVLFPRVSRPLWALPDPTTGLSGLSDTLTLGSLQRLVLSREVAFRVEFDGPVPGPEERYWRGPVLEETDGDVWRRSSEVRDLKDPERAYRADGPTIPYTVILEPHGQRWLLALELPAEVPEGATGTRNHELRTPRAVRRPLRYHLSSRLGRVGEALSETERVRALQLSAVSDRVRRLAESWRARNASDAQVVARGLEHFRSEPFVYSLEPPPVGPDPVDGFLFETRAGFCEHYAAAFATLLRTAGVPARVVTGYQGGEYNPLGGYWIVRQSDAHAWCEVWLEGSGWTRVDPTLAVAPQRVSRSIDLAATTGEVRYLRPEAAAFLRHVRNLWDSLGRGWNRWVVGYGVERQRSLLVHLGLGWFGSDHLAMALAALCALVLGGLAAWVLLEGAHEAGLEAVYGRWARKLERVGLPRLPHEGPVDYAARIELARDDLAEVTARVTELYVELRYGPGSGDAERVREGTRRLRRLVREFRPRTSVRRSEA